jgi:hypothetical protein
LTSYQQGKKIKLLPRPRREAHFIWRFAEAATADCRLQKGWLFSSAIPRQALGHFGLGDIRPDAMSGARPKNSGVGPNVARQSCSRRTKSGGERKWGKHPCLPRVTTTQIPTRAAEVAGFARIQLPCDATPTDLNSCESSYEEVRRLGAGWGHSHYCSARGLRWVMKAARRNHGKKF